MITDKELDDLVDLTLDTLLSTKGSVYWLLCSVERIVADALDASTEILNARVHPGEKFVSPMPLARVVAALKDHERDVARLRALLESQSLTLEEVRRRNAARYQANKSAAVGQSEEAL